jgi:glycosyltransferase involved in cell wall biosynthesis
VSRARADGGPGDGLRSSGWAPADARERRGARGLPGVRPEKPAALQQPTTPGRTVRPPASNARYVCGVPIDLAVLGQDPRFGGGGAAQTDAFISMARELGRTPELLHEPHPGLGSPELTWRRVEWLRQLRAARRLEPAAKEARSLWVVAPLAQSGGAAVRTRRSYACWAGTTIRSEWGGRARGLTPRRRLAAGMSIAGLERLERRVLRGAARVYATSPASRADVAAAAGVSEDDIGILPIPVDLERFAPAPDEVWLEALSRPVLTFVGRADDPRKNVPFLLDAFAEIRRVWPEARLRLISPTPLGAQLPGVEAVRNAVDVAAELRKAAVFMLPSRQEGFGIVAAEAMACGLPVVTTPSGGPEELVRDSGAGVVTKDLATAILQLLGARERLTEMRRLGRAYVDAHHAPDRFREALARALAEVDP